MKTESEIISNMRTSIDKILERTKKDIERVLTQTEAELEKNYLKKLRDLRKLRIERYEKDNKTEINYNINQYYMNINYTDKDKKSIIDCIQYKNLKCIELKNN